MNNAYAIIMAGGDGERFFPLSTPEKPKQFLTIFGGTSLLRQAVDRLFGTFSTDHIYVITANRFIDLSREELPMLPKENIIGEPCKRNTAAAVATACGLVMRKGGEKAIGCILTADHLISPKETFQKTLSDSIKVASETNAIVTMGILPTRPETEYGYLEEGDIFTADHKTKFYNVKRFVEKPNEIKAKEYFNSKKYLWNAGMFIWQAGVMKRAFEKSAKEYLALIDEVSSTNYTEGAMKKAYSSLKSISIDYAVMEKIDNIITAESTFSWNDVGSWFALEEVFPKDKNGNVIIGECEVEDCKNSIIVNPSDDGFTIMGVEDSIVVNMFGRVLCYSKSELKASLLRK